MKKHTNGQEPEWTFYASLKKAKKFPEWDIRPTNVLSSKPFQRACKLKWRNSVTDKQKLQLDIYSWTCVMTVANNIRHRLKSCVFKPNIALCLQFPFAMHKPQTHLLNTTTVSALHVRSLAYAAYTGAYWRKALLCTPEPHRPQTTYPKTGVYLLRLFLWLLFSESAGTQIERIKNWNQRTSWSCTLGCSLDSHPLQMPSVCISSTKLRWKKYVA